MDMDDCMCCDNFSGDVSAGNMGRKTEGGRKKYLEKLQAEQQMAEAKNTRKKRNNSRKEMRR